MPPDGGDVSHALQQYEGRSDDACDPNSGNSSRTNVTENSSISSQSVHRVFASMDRDLIPEASELQEGASSIGYCSHPDEDASLRSRFASALSFLASAPRSNSASGQDWVDTPSESCSDSQSSVSQPEMHIARSIGRWENDQDVGSCRRCQRKFNFFVRKHHCRRCGRIYCDACTTRRAVLATDELIIDPSMPEMLSVERHGPSRVCDWCVETYQLLSSHRPMKQDDSSFFTHILPFLNRGRRNSESNPLSSTNDSMSASILEECPVCYHPLHSFATMDERESHVKNCLERGASANGNPNPRYAISKLSADSVLIGNECIICMEEFSEGAMVARLNCLCCFHRSCIEAWLHRSPWCPTHSRALT